MIGARPSISVVRGDITQQQIDAIVNAANSALRPGGGVDGAITGAAGPEALADRELVIARGADPPLPTGDAVATIAGDLPCRWIIHTAGPIYAGEDRDRLLLASCHTRSLRIADELGASSVAFPAISCGIYGYPPQEAAPIAVGSVLASETAVRHVRFVLFDEAMEAIFRDALASAIT